MEIEPKFNENRVICRKRQFDENLDDDKIIQYAEEPFRINYFVDIIDQKISSLKSRLEQFRVYRNIFGSLFDFKKLKSLNNDDLKCYCLNLKRVLKHGEVSDIDDLYLFLKLRVLREIFQKKK